MDVFSGLTGGGGAGSGTPDLSTAPDITSTPYPAGDSAAQTAVDVGSYYTPSDASGLGGASTPTLDQLGLGGGAAGSSSPSLAPPAPITPPSAVTSLTTPQGPGATSAAAAGAAPPDPSGTASSTVAQGLPSASGDLSGLTAASPPAGDPTATASLDGAPSITSGGAGAGGGGAGGILSKLFGSGGASKGILPELVGGGALINDLMNANKLPPGAAALQNLANNDKAQASSYSAQAQGEGEGILPAGAQALVQQNLNANIAAIRSKYAQLGMSGSSAETQDINAARNASLAQTFQIGTALATQGLTYVTSLTGQEDSLLGQIMGAETAQNTELGTALAGFAGATTDANHPAAVTA